MAKLSFFPEKEFINRIKAADRSVLGELFMRHKKMVFSYVNSNGGNEADAEDLLQEAIIVLWQNVCADRFTLKAKLSTYILAVVKNMWRAELRKRSRLSNGAPPEQADGTASPLELLIDEEQKILLHAVLDSLNPVCRDLLLLFYFEERNLKDIAGILGFANSDVAKAKKYQCKKALDIAFSKALSENKRSVP